MRDSNGKDLDTFPSAMGVITRLACERAKQHGVEVDLLLRKAGLTREQIDDPRARLPVKSQIRFVELAAKALDDEYLGFTSLRNSIFVWEGCFITYWLRLTLLARRCSGERATARSSTKVLR